MVRVLRPAVVWRCAVFLALAIQLVGCRSKAASEKRPAAAAAGGLLSPEAFDVMHDKDERAMALFVEASRVMLHPRCVNCHPAGNTPTQGDERRVHDPPVARGPSDKGVAGLACTSCHQDANLELARVPGAPDWHLAPLSMAWAGLSPRKLCEQLKDPARNGGKTLTQITEHAAHDKLVAWGWSPGAGRDPAPGSQERFGALIAAWVKDGAACPSDDKAP